MAWLAVVRGRRRVHSAASARLLAPEKAAKHKATASKLRSWRVSLIRKKGQFLGMVEAPSERAAEAAAVTQFDLSHEQRRRLVISPGR